ncbi:MAG: hypothetical protein ACI4CC_08620 [Lachnospiraceae bacterium]
MPKLELQISILQKQLQQFPEGDLRICKNHNGYRWYHSHDHQINLIPKKKRSLAESLAYKQHLIFELSQLTHERDALLSYLQNFPMKHSSITQKLISSNEYKSLLSSHIVSNNQFIRDWLETPFTPNPFHPEHLIYPSITGQMRRSKSEVIIETALFNHELPYRYECPLEKNGILLYPDFTILHPRTYKEYYWEHFGKADDNGYALTIGDRIRKYCSIQIVPSLDLIMTFETKERPLDPNLVEETIQHYFGM